MNAYFDSWVKWVLERLKRRLEDEKSCDNLEPIPGPAPLPIVGNVMDIDLNNSLQSVLRLSEIHGPIFQLIGGDGRELFVGSRDLAHELCDEKRFCKVVYGALVRLRAAGGDGLFTAHHGSHAWGVARRILTPVFGPLKIRAMFDDMYDIAEQLCLKWARYGPDTPVNVVSDFTRLTLDTLALCAMGYRFNSFYLNEELHPYVQSMVRVLLESERQAVLPDFLVAMRRKAVGQFKSDVQTMSNICQDIIDKRHANPNPHATDLLHYMLHGHDPKTGERLSDEEIIWNLNTFLIAGHETSSGLLSFALYYLLDNPRVLEKARAEVDSVVGDRGKLNARSLQNLPYIEAILKETLRLQPPAAAFMVRPLEEGQVLGGKYLLKSTETITILLHKVHRDPSVWGHDADEFKPERMAHDKFKNLPLNSWKPFGNGMRSCIGREFAMQETKLVMAMLLQHFDLEKDDPSYKLKIHQSLTIKPDGFKIRVALRDGKRPVDLTNMHSSDSSAENRISGPTVPNRPLRSSEDFELSSRGHPMSILYGSNTGTCEALAHWLANDVSAAGFEAETMGMNEARGNLPRNQPVVIIAASYNGYPSDNAAEFFEWLSQLNSGSELQGIKYAVFGVGHRDWPATKAKVPRDVDDMLNKAGAERLTSMGFSDTSTGDMFSDIGTWSRSHLCPALVDKYTVPHTYVSRNADMDIKVATTMPLRLGLRRGFFQAIVSESRCLSQPGVARKQHMTLRLPPHVSYRTGDRIQVLPKNDDSVVQRVLSRFQLDPDTILTINSTRSLMDLPVNTQITAADLFSTYVELKQIANQRNIQELADLTPDPAIKKRLENLISEDGYHRSSVLDLLERFPSLVLSISTFLRMLPRMRPRTYSLSSAPTQQVQHCTITYTVVSSEFMPGNRHDGVASNYLTSLNVGQFVHVSLFPATREFQLPTIDMASTTPIIMIATGAGLAPFRGFLQERASQLTSGTLLAPALLFYGCRGAALDDMYRDEFDEWERTGVVTVRRAYSRDPTAKAKYVSDSIQQSRVQVGKLWGAGAIVYVCSGKKICDAISTVLDPILFETDSKSGKTSTENLDTWRKELPRERYVSEIFN